jgi:hypothetical protein
MMQGALDTQCIHGCEGSNQYDQLTLHAVKKFSQALLHMTRLSPLSSHRGKFIQQKMFLKAVAQSLCFVKRGYTLPLMPFSSWSAHARIMFK